MSATAGLVGLGWSDRLAAAFQPHARPGHRPARVVAEERGLLHVATADGERPATLAGRLRHAVELDPALPLPGVGDWVVVSVEGSASAVVHAVLPRSSAIVRLAPGDHARPTQTLAANVDVAFAVTSMNRDFSLRRLERYLAMTWDSGARPVAVLSKADLADDPTGMRVATEAVAPGVDVIVVSVVTGHGLADVRRHLGPGRTAVFLGSSGVGKSSLVNALAGADRLATATIREDDARGRHTTTRRQLLHLADGLVIDTPGLRELGLADGDGLREAFDDMASIAADCRFGDCRHAAEPGCAVRAAVADGRLGGERLAAFRKLEREARRAELALDPVARRTERRRHAVMMKGVGRRMDLKYGVER